MDGLGKILVYIGIFLVVLGIVLSVAGKIPWFGHMPGDITIERDRFTFYFPIATCIVISVIVSIILYFFRR